MDKAGRKIHIADTPHGDTKRNPRRPDALPKLRGRKLIREDEFLLIKEKLHDA